MEAIYVAVAIKTNLCWAVSILVEQSSCKQEYMDKFIFACLKYIYLTLEYRKC